MTSPSGRALRALPACAVAMTSMCTGIPAAIAQSYPPRPSGPDVTYTPMPRPAPAPPGEAAPTQSTAVLPTPFPSPPSPSGPLAEPPVPSPPYVRSDGPVAVAARSARSGPHGGRRGFGIGLDVGVPDGINAGLVLAPTDWLRLMGAIGTNTASLEYRGGLGLVPVRWGPSFNFEIGHCNMATPNSVVRTFFATPAWVTPYFQQFGYTYVNAHLGFDVPLGDFVVFLHAGYSYIMGTVRSPSTVVVVDKTNNTSVTVAIGQDGEVNASTLSAKLGVIYMFGGF